MNQDEDEYKLQPPQTEPEVQSDIAPNEETKPITLPSSMYQSGIDQPETNINTGEIGNKEYTNVSLDARNPDLRESVYDTNPIEVGKRTRKNPTGITTDNLYSPKKALESAIEEGDKEAVEEIVENNPTESEELLQDDSPLNTEAEQAKDGGVDAEVKNEAVEEAVEHPEETLNSLSEDFKDVNELNDYLEQNYPEEQIVDTKFGQDNYNALMSAPLDSEEFLNAWDNAIDLAHIDEGAKAELLNIFSNPDFVATMPEELQAQLNELKQSGIGGLLSSEEPHGLISPKMGYTIGSDDEFLERAQPSEDEYNSKQAAKEADVLPPEDKGGIGESTQGNWWERDTETLNNNLTKAQDTLRHVSSEFERAYREGRIDSKFRAAMGRDALIAGAAQWRNSKYLALQDYANQTGIDLNDPETRKKLYHVKFGKDINKYYDELNRALDTNAKPNVEIEQVEIPDEVIPSDVQDDLAQESDWVGKWTEDREKEEKRKYWESLVKKPGEDPYPKVADQDFDPRVEELNNWEGPEGVGAEGVRMHKDEDFAGPDELPALYQGFTFRDRDYVPESQQLSTINDGLPAEQYYEPVYDTSMYNFDWDWEDITPERIEQEVDEDEEIPEEEKEEVKERRKRIAKWLGTKVNAQYAGGNAGSTPKLDYDKSNGSMSFGGGKGILSGSGGIGSFMANPKYNKPTENKVEEVKSEASKAPAPAETTAKTGSRPIATPAGNRTSNGGNFGSGSVDKKGNSLIKVVKNQLPNGEANNQPDAFNGEGVSGSSSTNNLKESHIAQLERRIKSLDRETAEHFGFSTKYKHVEYHEIPLDECSGGDLQDIEEILSALGV